MAQGCSRELWLSLLAAGDNSEQDGVCARLYWAGFCSSWVWTGEKQKYGLKLCHSTRTKDTEITPQLWIQFVIFSETKAIEALYHPLPQGRVTSRSCSVVIFQLHLFSPGQPGWVVTQLPEQGCTPPLTQPNSHSTWSVSAGNYWQDSASAEQLRVAERIFQICSTSSIWKTESEDVCKQTEEKIFVYRLHKHG